MKYRILPAEEWGRLAEYIPLEFLPSPETATAAIAEDDGGEIWGILFLQLQLHLEPLLIRHSRVSFKRLHETLSSALSQQKGLTYFAFTDDPNVGRMAELCGMERVDMQIYRREIE